MTIAIITDSTSDLPFAEAKSAGISMIPLKVLFGEKTYLDRVELTASEFYQMLKTEKAFPTTSQPSVGEFVALYEQLLSEHDGILCVILSEKFSGTLQAAQMAKSMVKGRVEVIDSKMTSFGQAWQALEAASMAANGASFEEIINRIQVMQEHIHSYFIVDSMEHLHRGGRIGKASMLIGTMLQIKPILKIGNSEVEISEKVRTQRKAIEALATRFAKEAENAKLVRVAVAHSDAPELAAEFLDRLQSLVPNAEYRVGEIDPVLGVHAGAGVLGIIYHIE